MDTMLLDNLDLTEAEFKQISDIVYAHCGINLHNGKKELVRARLAKLLRLRNFKKFSDYIEYVENDKTGTEFSDLIDSLSTNLTSFFRENQHFEFLVENILPRLIKNKTVANRKKIRCWSAGCSSGEEPYSIAITLLDNIADINRWDVKILATDISTSSLETAKRGLYSQSRIDPVPPAQRNKYLTVNRNKEQKVYQVNQSLRDMIIFRYMNLMQDWPVKPPLDFIFCRNVMIYFDKSTQEKLVNRYWDMLDNGGVLFTGHSESLTGITHKFKYVRPTIYLKQ